jgi:hypothetical protein
MTPPFALPHTKSARYQIPRLPSWACAERPGACDHCSLTAATETTSTVGRGTSGHSTPPRNLRRDIQNVRPRWLREQFAPGTLSKRALIARD